jgi:hypothetical protein
VSSSGAFVAGERLCPACGLASSADARYCSRCGHALDEGVGARHLFGVLAPGPIFVLGCLVLLAAVLALIAGSAIAAIVLAAFAAASFVLFASAAERDPGSPVARVLLRLARRVRGWVVFGKESLEAWAHATRDVAKLRGESRSLRRERTRAIGALGEAAYREDEATAGALRLRIREIDEGLATREQAKSASLAKARRHVHEEHVAVQPTQRFTVDELTSGGEQGGG